MGSHGARNGKVTVGGKAAARAAFGPRPGRAAELAEAIAEPAKRAPGRKDTKRWCRGKPGVEHLPVVVPHFQYGHKCGWYETGHWVRTGPVPPRGVTLPKWPRDREWVTDGRRWSCSHEYQCRECGKYLGPVPGCPDKPK